MKEHSDAKNKYTEEDIIKMLEFLVDNIFVVFAGKVFQQIVGISMGTNCAPLLAHIFLYSYEAEFIQSLLSAGKKRLASQFNFTYRYIDDVLSINNPDYWVRSPPFCLGGKFSEVWYLIQQKYLHFTLTKHIITPTSTMTFYPLPRR